MPSERNEHYTLPDKRGQEGYEDWDKAYERWCVQTEEAQATILERIENKDFKILEEE